VTTTVANAKRAELAFQKELNRSEIYIQAGSWDPQRKGLLAGERDVHAGIDAEGFVEVGGHSRKR
jgi:hypothetical protein